MDRVTVGETKREAGKLPVGELDIYLNIMYLVPARRYEIHQKIRLYASCAVSQLSNLHDISHVNARQKRSNPYLPGC